MNQKFPLWFDDKVTYHFFRDNTCEIPKIPTPIGKIKPYFVTPELTRHENRKKRIMILSSLLGNHQAQKIFYLHLSVEKFLRLKMPINRISSLLNESFLFFERYLYLKLNWEKGESGFYRDHTLHSYHEAYLGFKVLQKIPHLRQEMKNFLRSNNPINNYLGDSCRIGMSDDKLDCIIYRTWFISSLFHDIGYVMEFNHDMRQMMLEYNRWGDLLLASHRSNFNNIQMLLGNSLLFNTINLKEIEKNYNDCRHGLYSALLILSTFYSAPSFDSIDIYDRVAIELAARAIYFHDSPEEQFVKKIFTGKVKTSKNNLIFDIFNKFFEKTTVINIKEIVQGNINSEFEMGDIYKINFEKINKYVKKKNLSVNRKEFQEDPFSYYLRFIDELQVFGRNRFSFQTESNIEENYTEESPYSYYLPKIRNLVQFPAQIIDYNENENTLNVYYVADSSLYKHGKYFDNSPNSFHEKGLGRFLMELYWLRESAIQSHMFTEINFYWIEADLKKNR